MAKSLTFSSFCVSFLQGCVVELQNLSRAELNGQRGLCLGAILGCKEGRAGTKAGRRLARIVSITRPPATSDRIGVRLDDGREVSVPRAKARAIIGFREVGSQPSLSEAPKHEPRPSLNDAARRSC